MTLTMKELEAIEELYGPGGEIDTLGARAPIRACQALREAWMTLFNIHRALDAHRHMRVTASIAAKALPPDWREDA